MPPELKYLTDTGSVFALFLVAIIVFHIVFVFMPSGRLTKKQWAYVQYVILILALTSLLGAVSKSRQLISGFLSGETKEIPQSQFRWLRATIDRDANETVVFRSSAGNGAVAPSEVKTTEQEFDDTRKWFTQISSIVPKEAPSDNRQIPMSSLPAEPRVSDQHLVHELSEVNEAFDRYNYVAKRQTDFETASRPSAADNLLTALLPFGLSLALALQFTKVTGENWFLKL